MINDFGPKSRFEAIVDVIGSVIANVSPSANVSISVLRQIRRLRAFDILEKPGIPVVVSASVSYS